MRARETSNVGVMHQRRQAWVTWLFVGALLAVSLTLGIVQYRWIGEVSRAERERLQSSLQTSLNRLRQEFNAEISSAAAGLVPDRPLGEEEDILAAYANRFAIWRETSRHTRLFRTIAIAVRDGETVSLFRIDGETGEARRAEWPAQWEPVKERMTARIHMRGDRPPRGPGPGSAGPITEDFPNLFEIPRFSALRQPGRMRVFSEMDWLLLEVDTDYAGSTMLPDLLRRYLGASGNVEYDAELVVADYPSTVIYRSPEAGSHRLSNADASVRVFDPRPDVIMRRAGLFRGLPRGRPPDENANSDRGRWLLSVRHRAGSLEAVVDKGRRSNIIVTSALLLLMIAAVVALVRYTRRAQTLAELQMQFVAGVSHELRTPLSVMRTAGHNLQGRIAVDPDKVRRYGSLVEEESNKLTAIVEQVLSFANINAGRLIGVREAVSVADIIDEAIEADRKLVQESGCVLEKAIDPDTPPVLADPLTLRHALQNLISNAAKYGKEGESIRISAAAVEQGSGGPTVEIRVEDRGSGIPAAELAHIFEPFYRGKKAVEDQIHGTGLGLSLAKRIIDAHDGEIRVSSEEGKGTRFTVRLPAAPITEHELTNSAG